MTGIKQYSTPDKEDVRRRASGRWEQIIPALVPQLNGAVSVGPKKKVACPFHPGKTEENLRVLADFSETGGVACNSCGVKSDGFATLVWAGRTFAEAVCDVDEWLGGSYAGMSPEAIARQQAQIEARRQAAERQQVADDKRYRRRLNEVWREAVPIDHPDAGLARLHLRIRGLYGLAAHPSCLRFHRSLAYTGGTRGNPQFRGYWPAILARLNTQDGKPGSILRIYIAMDGGKADLPERKKLMSAPSTTVLTGGAIPLSGRAAILGVAEGVETALAVQLLFGIHCWSTFSAQLMEGFVPPPGVQKVLVFADKDRNERGQRAARTLVQRLWADGIMAGIRLPEEDIPPGAKGIDWLDVLNARRAESPGLELPGASLLLA